MRIPKDTTGEIVWHSPSNIALVKYWGKRNRQIPENPSLSFTLRNAISKTSVKYQHNKNGLNINFTFEGKHNQAFGLRIEKFLANMLPEYPWLNELELQIDSSNTFPHSAGIASSAAAMSSLALCIQTIKYNLEGRETGTDEFYKESSNFARLASGSASRSVYGGFTTWGEIKSYESSSDLYASKLPGDIDKSFKEIQDAILIIDSGEKQVSSSKGHALMQDHPFARARFQQANDNILLMMNALKEGNWDAFIEITELEAMTLHALIMSSASGVTLLRPSTLTAIEKIRKFRKQHGVPVCFTLDAGPNIHLLYPENSKNQVVDFINAELAMLCQGGKWIDDGVGPGPVLIQNNHA